MIKKILLSFLILILASCSEDRSKLHIDKKTLKSSTIKLDDKENFVQNFFSKLPKPINNSYWFSNNYQPAENLSLNNLDNNYDTYDIGAEPKKGFNISSGPLVADGKIFTLSGGGEVQARDFNDPDKLLWEVNIDEKYNTSRKKHGTWRKFTSLYMDSDEFLGGALTYNLGVVYSANKRGNVTAIRAETGKIIWQKELGIPIKSSPSANNGKLIVTTLNNKTFSLDLISGNILWQHEGISQKTGISGSPAPLVTDDKIIVTYSSGEIYALDSETGQEIWSTVTAGMYGANSNPMMSDIVSSPIFSEGGLLFVTGEGKLVLIDSNDGINIWETPEYGFNGQPWLVGGIIFAVTRFGDMAAVDFKTGKIIWRKPMADPDDIDDDDLAFTSPIMASGKLFVADNNGTLRSYNPKNGAVINEYNIPDDVYISPIVVNGKMLLLNNGSKLIVME